MTITEAGRAALAGDRRRPATRTASRVGATDTWTAADVERAAHLLRDLLFAEGADPVPIPASGMHKFFM